MISRSEKNQVPGILMKMGNVEGVTWVTNILLHFGMIGMIENMIDHT